ncbi:MAG: sigma-70 family RNA polymerase sigma factor [Anaerolineae bacterium]|nr:sigma-70 family RNA polymerase sigma factor [Anaerolineae bacterium]
MSIPNFDDVAVTPTMAEWDDAALMQACVAGDEQAWAVLLERYGRLIYTIPLRFGLPRSVADEIFQDVCLLLLEGRDNLRDYRRVRAWLVTVTRRLCIRRLRQQDRELVAELPEEMEDSAESAVESDLTAIEEEYLVHQALERLSTLCQELIRALFFESPPRSYDAIAKALDIPVGSVGPTRIRCLEKLRREMSRLDQEGGGP